MAVPQNAPPLRRKLGRKGNTVRIRRKNPIGSSWYCGTVITVPYKMVERRGDSRIARRPSGAGKSPDARRRKNNRTSFKSPRHCEARRAVAIPSLFRVPLVPRDCRVGLCPPRNDVVTLGWFFWFGGGRWCVGGRFLNRPYGTGCKRAPVEAGAQMLLGISCRYDRGT